MGRILHFGLGSFARAHLLDYTSDAGGWDVVGVSLRSASIRDGLRAQGYDYTLCVQGQGDNRISILSEILVAPENPEAVLAAIETADMVSLTVTEKGYHLDAQGLLDMSDPAIMSDLNGQGPSTVIGFLAFGLARRTRPLTVLSCDNRTENGTALRNAVQRFAEQAGLTLNWDKLRFPNSMVDRITPATTDALRETSGDPMAVPTEAFREWVIEDSFVGAKPDWPDVQYVDDVAPHELRKLRMLNGAHSLMAYAGLEKGLVYVHEAVRDPALRALVQDLMAGAGATLPDALQDQVPAYATALIERFENPDLAHRLDQIAMDGSQKVPYRFVETLRASPVPAVVEGLRAWIKFCTAQVRAGHALNDPKADEIAQAVRSNDPVKAMLELVDASDLLPFMRA